MADEVSKCPLCGWDARITHQPDLDWVKCELCGEFKIVRTLLATIGKPEVQELLPYLRAHTRQASKQGEIVTLHTMNWKDFALSHKSTPFSRKVQKVLDLVASRCEPGTRAELHLHADAPLVDANSDHQFAYILSYLEETGLLVRPGGDFYELTPTAWEQRETTTTGGTPGNCFVAMSFHDSLKEAYDSGIYLAVKNDCKMEPIRVDRVHHNEKICDRIIAEIRTCQFLIADVTLQRAGVYFEAGFAMGLGRPVIWSCREDDFDNVHFDTRQYNHIVWKEPGDLRVQLTDRIKATIAGAV
jgi:hypothetical protein